MDTEKLEAHREAKAKAEAEEKSDKQHQEIVELLESIREVLRSKL
jgi:hypothetical protein